MRWATLRKLRDPDNVKLYWFRLTEEQQRKLLTGNAKDFIDPDLRDKFNLKTETLGNTVYTYREVTVVNEKTGKTTIKKEDKREFCRVMSCSTFYNDKGVGYFDNSYKGEYICVLDEMNREQSEKNCFDIVYNFSNQLENILRSYKNYKIFLIGNTLEESSDLLANLNFLPDGFGRYKLKRKEAVVDYIKPNEKYIERRKGAASTTLNGKASTFTNEVEMDRSLICNKRERYNPHHVIKFDKSEDRWFTVWNNGIISQYTGQQNLDAIPMTRYLNEVYSDELRNSVRAQFDARMYRFTTLACYKRFQKEMRILFKK